jgi:membrane-associated phospholipid phosphatase
VTALAGTLPAAGRPWKRAALWLLCLAPFFYLTYGAANWIASGRSDVGTMVFGWERHIPFLAWTIIPYWSINALYGLSLFVCADAGELDTHGRRLFTAQVVAVACFILFPLRFTFDRPEVPAGPSGFLFDALTSFDQPFNQAPSLHIALLVILWALYIRHVPRRALWPMHAWFVLIGASVLTTYQHHFIDIPTGALLGLFCLWLWPDGVESPATNARLTADRRRRGLALRYAAGGAACAALALLAGGWGLWLLWPAVSLCLVAANYAVFGAAGFQKRSDGRMSAAARWLFAPYLAGAWINSRLWTRHDPVPAEVIDGVFIGRLPAAGELRRGPFTAVVDLCAELPGAAPSSTYHAEPRLDLVAPSPEGLRAASDLIERARKAGPVLVCCALGYSRSAAAVATWLLRSGRRQGVDAAVATVHGARPRIVLDDDSRAAIAAAGAA